MPWNHPYKPNSSDDRQPPRGAAPDGRSDLDLDELAGRAIEAGSRVGSAVLGGLSGVIESVSEALAGRDLRNKTVPFQVWRKRLDRWIKEEKQDGALAVMIVGWVMAGCFGIAALVMWILAAVGPAALGLSPGEHLVFPILMACFAPITAGFVVMALLGGKKYGFYKRLRRCLNAARDWVSPVAELAALTGRPADKLCADLRRGIESDSLPGVLLAPDAATLYWDDARYNPPPQPAPADDTATPADPQDAALAAFRREGRAFLDYLRSCRGALDAGADEQLARMEKTCAAILGFVYNHPEQLPRLRRFREYYLPTTRKLLDTARGLGDPEAASAGTIRREITGILYTLNGAYSTLYDTLLQDVQLDVSTEIDTLETMLRQDGLTHGFAQDFSASHE